jgi:hypothetical protein
LPTFRQTALSFPLNSSFWNWSEVLRGFSYMTDELCLLVAKKRK